MFEKNLKRIVTEDKDIIISGASLASIAKELIEKYVPADYTIATENITDYQTLHYFLPRRKITIGEDGDKCIFICYDKSHKTKDTTVCWVLASKKNRMNRTPVSEQSRINFYSEKIIGIAV